jgi:hypothetical protein
MNWVGQISFWKGGKMKVKELIERLVCGDERQEAGNINKIMVEVL